MSAENIADLVRQEASAAEANPDAPQARDRGQSADPIPATRPGRARVLMGLYLVSNGNRNEWVAWQNENAEHAEMYVYVPNTGRFHLNRALAHDFYVDNELTYQPINPEHAHELIAAGVGRLDAQAKGPQLARFKADTGALTITDVLK